ncbi:MAG: nitric oxide reductase transcriptional regulator NorR [Deltaproteobacteria bacterium]|nr:MAG: nitric oxide reductase transcriptional regulator NorR [Deltaproteobacteria bacterium]
MLSALLDLALDLTASLPTAERYQRVLDAVAQVVPCDAAALLRREGLELVPVAVAGLAAETLGVRFALDAHPRLSAIVSSRAPVRFAADDSRPDPYDGLVVGAADGHPHVHACMGSALYLGDELVGAITVDALEAGRFDGVDDQVFSAFAALAAATMRTAALIEALERTAARRGKVAEHLVSTALQRQGGELVGTSEEMRRLRAEIDVIAGSDLTILVTGETGVGKELVARTLHARSARSGQPLVYLNCAALPEALAESELFGHQRGAFTGAVEDRAGRFELADGGTLFLDEVGELPLALQPKLLRALQSGELQRVGADRDLRVDVRVVAATNRNVQAEVAAGRFRADLYHRLAVYPIHVPPLRARPGDIPQLAGLFLERARVQLGLASARLTPAGREALLGYGWPGNVRELEHVILRSVLRASGGRQRADALVDTRHLGLGPAVGALDELTAGDGSPEAASAAGEASLVDATRAFQRRRIQAALDASGGVWAEAARRLGMHRANLHRLAGRLGLR